VQARLEDQGQCLLVIIGATPEGKKELVGLIDGVRESAQSWKELLLDLKRRGLSMGPELAVAEPTGGLTLHRSARPIGGSVPAQPAASWRAASCEGGPDHAVPSRSAGKRADNTSRRVGRSVGDRHHGSEMDR
jgi:hypothetical protein